MRAVRAVATSSGFWKWYGPFTSTNHLISRFRAAKLTGHQMRPLGYDAVVMHLRKKSTIFDAKLLFTRLIMVSVSLCPQLKETNTPKIPHIRVLLTTYMISYFQRDVFERFEALENTVMREGQLLLELVESFIAYYEAHSSCISFPRLNCLALIPQMERYVQAFEAWRQPDSVNVITQIKNALNALIFAARRVPSELPDDTPEWLEIEANIKRMRGKLFQIGGPAAVDSFYDTIMDALTFELYEALNQFDWEDQCSARAAQNI
jgi:hypothetical protein